MQNIWKRFRGTSIKKKLVFAFLIILTIPGFIIGGVSYQTAKENFDQQLTKKAKENVAVLNSVIKQNMEAKYVDAAYFADVLTEDTYPDGQEDIVRTKIQTIYEASPRGRRHLYWNADREIYKRAI
ncbi:hypothetical protein ACUC2M_22650 [Bacillus cytotoxicus]